MQASQQRQRRAQVALADPLWLPRIGLSVVIFALLLLTLSNPAVVVVQAFVPRPVCAGPAPPSSFGSRQGSGIRMMAEPLEIRTLLPRDIKLQRYIGEQRLITEEEIDPRDGNKARGAFGKIRNPAARGRAAGKQQPSRDTRTLGTGVRLFEAVLAQTGERVVLKEFLPIMRNLAASEIELYRYLYDWVGTNAPDWGREDLPVVPLAGFLQIGIEVEDEAFVYDWIQRFGPTVPPPRAGNTWVALATPSLITLTAVPRLASSSPAYQAKGLLDAFFPDAPWKKRLEYTKAVARGAVDALSLLHQAGVVHGYVSPSTLLVSTPDVGASASQVGVQLSDLGFACNALNQQGMDFNALVRRDWRSCAFTLLELFLRLLADEEAEDETPGAAVYEGFSLPFAQIEAAALQAVAERQFQGDISLGLRSLVTQEPGYKRACAYLDADAGAGWTLFQDMANPDRLLAAANGDVYALGDRLLDLPFLR